MRRRIEVRSALALIIAAIWAVGMMAYSIAEETPIGTIEGTITGRDTGRPIDRATVWIEKPTGKDEYDVEVIKTVKTDEHGRFKLTNIPEGSYAIGASGRVHSIPNVKVAVKEGRIEKLNLELEPSEPYFNFYTSQKVFTPRETPKVVIDGFTKGDEVKLTIFRINPDKLLSKEGASVRQALTGYDPNSYISDIGGSSVVASTETRTIKATQRDSEGIYHQSVKLDALKTGLYILAAKVDGLSSASWISITDLGLIAKEAEPVILVYTVHPDTGEPVSDADVSVLVKDAVTASGTTDAKGLWKTSFKPETGAPPFRFIFARKGESVAFFSSESYTQVAENQSIYAYTDRPIYRPNHTVHFRGIIRKFMGDAYQTPKQGEVRIEVKDRRDSLIYSGTLAVSKFGTFHGGFKLPVYAATGGYSIVCTYKGQQSMMSFSVAEYRKPEFVVTVEMPKKHCVRGERVKAKVKASYFFGAPVAGAEVSYTISRSDYWFWPGEDDEDYGSDYEGEYSDHGGYGETVREGKVRTGPDGTAEIEFVAYWKRSKDDYFQQDQQFMFFASVMDASGQESSADGNIIASQGNFMLQVSPEDYVSQPRQGTKVIINATDYNKKPQSGVRVDVSAGEVTWENNEEGFHQTNRATVTTDRSGNAVYQFTPPKPGYYTIRVTAEDNDGNSIKSAGYIWVAGKDEYQGYRYPDLELVLDKKTYKPGDKAKLLINTKETGAVALVSVEGRRLYDYQQVKITSKTTTIEIPVKSEYKPNFYVSVCYVKNKKMVSQEVRAKVSLAEETLNLSVKSDKQKYEPGQTATYTVKTTDSKGKPVQAEVSLGVVDEAIYAIQEDDTPAIKSYFYRNVPNSVTTRYSFPEVYLSGDKAGFTGKVRTEFLDTAFWKANVVTDTTGTAKVKFKLPDNLTTWRATARACTEGTVVGDCRNKITVTKNLLVRLETPRFLIQNDEVVISALVHNYLPSSQTVKVALGLNGARTRDDASRTVTVASQGMQRVQWRVSAPSVGSTSITAYAVAPGAQDAMKLTIPVKPDGQRMVEQQSGTMKSGTTTRRFVIRGDAIDGGSEMRIRLAPSIASTMLGSLEYLAAYPYGCTEQTMSAFLPDVVIWNTLKTLNIDNKDLAARLPDMVGKGLNRLYDFQNDDGGWGWCEYGEHDMWMTAYVIYGLQTARNAGFQVSDDVFGSGVTNLKRQVTNSFTAKRPDVHNQIFALYVLSLTGDNGNEFKEGLHSIMKRGVNTAQGQALVAMTLANFGETDLAQKYVARLWKNANVSGDLVYWSTDKWDYMDTESTAIALMAAVQLTPNDARIPSVIRWMLQKREFNHWYSTRDTAMSLYALSNYLKQSKELEPSFTATIKRNGAKVAAYRFDKNSVFQPEKEIVIPAADLGQGNQNVTIEISGEGTLYYTAELIQYVRRPIGTRTVGRSGITVKREYLKLESRWDESNHTNRLLPSKRSSTDIRVGDIIQVKLTVNSPREYARLLVEDYLPAGCEAFDQGRLEPWEWDYWYVDKDVRDERVSFYVETLPKGKSVLEYQMRASTAGTFHAMPTIVEAMYQPSISGSGIEDTVTVRE